MADYTLVGWTPEVTKLSAANFGKMDAAIKDAAEHHRSGLFAAIPNPDATTKNWLYFATDRGVVYANLDGASWSRWSADAPLGAVYDFAALNIPTGFLECDAAAVLRTDYFGLLGAITRLFSGSTTIGSNVVTNVIQGSLTQVGVGCPIEGPGIPAGVTVTALSAPSGGFQDITLSANATATAAGVTLRALPYGGGNGSTTFNLPDFRGRAAVGSGAGGGLTARKNGEKGGEETHILTTPEIPSHSHALLGSIAADSGGDRITMAGNDTGNSSNGTSNAGGGLAHNNMQPFLVTRKIIKAF